MKLTFKECLESKKGIDKKLDYYQNKLNSFPKMEGGLISDIYRKKPEYKETQQYFNFWFNQLRQLNAYINKNHRIENRKFQLEKRLNKNL